MLFTKENIKQIQAIFNLLIYSMVLFLFVNNSYGQKKTFSCIDENGKILFHFESHYIRPYSEGLAVFKTKVEENGEQCWRAGFINEKGKIALPPVYDSRDISKYGFRNGVSWVKMPGEKKYTLINQYGDTVSKKTYENVGRFNDGICAVYNKERMGFIDNSGKEIIPCEYSGESQFNEDLVFVKKIGDKNEKYGFLNKSGETVIPFVYTKTRDHKFINGECLVTKNDSLYVINKNGDIVYCPEKNNIVHQFSDGMAVSYVENEKKKYGFINKHNEWNILPVYDTVTNFINGYSIVATDGKYGVINTKNEIIIPLDYDKITGNCDRTELFICYNNETKTYYNCNGDKIEINDMQEIKARRKEKYFIYRDKYNKWGYLNHNGNIHIPAQYDFVGSFSEGKAWIY
ncbi:MAG: WG repeat-containing protein [Bacteroidales bacterium]|jgi:hypothetical protein|nr:WG repeat-containing protein [Bacteroidales bacterium]